MINKKPRFIVSNKKNNTLYEYLGDNTYKNLNTKTIGKVPVEKAQKIFAVPLSVNLMVKENPLLIDFIEMLGCNECVVSMNGESRTYKC